MADSIREMELPIPIIPREDGIPMNVPAQAQGLRFPRDRPGCVYDHLYLPACGSS
jgi:hypothetical protein